MPPVTGQLDHHNPRIDRLQPLQEFQRRISGAIVDEHNLKTRVGEHGSDLVRERRDIAGLVLYRNDDRDVRRGLGFAHAHVAPDSRRCASFLGSDKLTGNLFDTRE